MPKTSDKAAVSLTVPAPLLLTVFGPHRLLKNDPLQCYVDGKPFSGSGSYQVRDPHTPSSTLHTVSSITADDVPKVLEIADAAAKKWKRVSVHVHTCAAGEVDPRSGRLTLRAISSPRHAQTSVVERRNIFLRAAKILRERTQEFAGVEFHETTSSQMWAGFEITLAADSCVPLPSADTRLDDIFALTLKVPVRIEETAATATLALRGEIATTDRNQRAYIERCPYGVVLGIAPWNAPVV